MNEERLPLITGLAHVGIAVNDLQYMLAVLRQLGFELVRREEVRGQGASSNIVQAGDLPLELLDAHDPSGNVGVFLSKHGPGLHHLCLSVSDLGTAVAAAERGQRRPPRLRPSQVRGRRPDRTGTAVWRGAVSGRRVVNPGWSSYQHLTYSPAVAKGGLLFVSGLNAVDEDGVLRGETLAEQADEIYRKLGEILAAAGAGFEDVVKTTDYITDREGYRETAAVRARYLGPSFPAATGVVVKELLGRGVRIEIDAVAVLGED